MQKAVLSLRERMAFLMYGIEKKWEKNLNGFYIKNAGYNENPFQLQNVSRSALKLRFFDGLGLR